jgi:ATP-dependent Clp protease ATP-binding subunit ClpA
VSGVQDRLSATAREVMRLALAESEQLGHGYIGDEHVLLGLLRQQAGVASSLLRGQGLDLASARAELQRLSAAGLMPRSRADDAGALRAVGIDVEAVRQRLVAAFGADAVGAAVWRASQRPWWRGGGRRRTPLCGPPFFAKRAMHLASCHAESREAAAVTPEHLLHGVLRDLEDPYGAQLGRRGRRHLAQLGWTIGPVNPASALLQAHHVDPVRLRTELDRMSF